MQASDDARYPATLSLLVECVFRYACGLQRLYCPLTNGHIQWVIAERERSVPLGRKERIKLESGLRFSPGLSRFAHQMQCNPQMNEPKES